jgi:hypothetical protein
MHDAGADLLIADLLQRLDDRFRRTLHIRLDEDMKVLARTFLELRHHLLERSAARGDATRLTPLALAIIGDLSGARFVLDDDELVARFRRRTQAQHFDRNRGTRILDLLALVVDEGAHPAPGGAGDEDIAQMQGAALHQDGRDRTAATIELGFDDDAGGLAIGIGLEIEHFRLQEDGVEQLVEIGALERRDFDLEHVTTHAFHHDLVL